jgi:hypothetical protein
MSRNQIDENLFSFEIIISGEPKNISYLILKGDIPKLESDVLDQSVIQNLRKMRIAIAFQLDTSQKIPVVQPINDANVCVYFPAIKERSGLKFHIHAPFASTPSRDVIKNSQENITILKGISALLVSNLENLKKKGYLTEGFFATLPGGDDELGPMYSHFREDIISEFKGKTSLIPTSDGGYIDAAHAITAPDNFQNSIQIETLQKMLQFRLGKDADAIKYSLNFKNARAQKFITNLKLKSFGLMELTKILNEFSSINQIKALQAIFQNISITEYRNILILFSHGSQKTLIELENLPFLMLNQENLVFGRPKDTFLPSPKFQDNGNLISKKIIDFSQKSQSEEQNLIKQGLQNLGVRVLDDWAMLDLNISKISKMHKLGDAVDESQIAESKEILENLLTEVGSDSDRIKSITALPIFIGITKEGSKIWSSLDRTFIDSPYEFTGLLSVREHLPEQHQIELWDGYLNVENFKKLLVHSRVMREVRPEKIPLPNRCSDWEIKNFDKMLETGDEQFLLHVWEMLTNAENQGLGWEIKTELSAGKLQYVDSSFVSDLRYSPWLPDLNGKKLRPTFITQASLNQKFVYKQTKLVEAIKFDGSSKEAIQRERKLAIQRQERNELAQELGFKDFAEVEAFQKLKSLQPKLISDLINSLEYHFPEEIVQDFEAKMVESAKILGSAVEVKVVESLIRERKNYKETHRAMKEFLRNKYYVGEVMKCQICSLIMPFKLLNGKYYFEAVFFIRNLEREFQCNGLALCPTCAARFQNTLQMSAHELRSEVLNATILGTGSSSIRIKMTNSEFNLSFTDDHLLELKTILREIEI